MDELYILGCLFLVFALVVALVLAVIGFNRSTAARQEIARLRQRIEALEQRGANEIAPEPVQSAAPAVVTAPVVEDAPAPVDPWRSDTPAAVAEPAPAPTPAAKQPSAFGGILTSLARWFMQGNPLAKLGILLLFLGLSFLLRLVRSGRRGCTPKTPTTSDGLPEPFSVSRQSAATRNLPVGRSTSPESPRQLRPESGSRPLLRHHRHHHAD